jgi:anti-repressor protein|nr:MAG: antirepressor protein KilAC domain [Bacteriophage sp.]
MNNEIKVFSNEEFGSIRRVEIDGEYWLSGKDVAQALGYAKPENALSAHVDDEDKTTTLVQGTGSNYKSKATVINESGLYSLVLSSKLPSAKKFKRWVTSEVLPSVRKHGAYMTPETLEAAILNPDYLLKVATALKAETDKRKALEAKVSADAPKVLFADSVAASSSTVLVGELAKIMRQNGVDMGERRLFRWMRDNGYLIKRNGTDYNMPTQASMEQGLFRIKETVINHSDGHTSVSKTPKVTGKGQTFFLNKFLGEGKTV